jgi:replicative DNA helicase
MSPNTLDVKLPPHSLEAEASVIGGLLLNGAALDRIPELRPEHFYRDDHATIFRAIREEITEGRPADVVTVCEALQRTGKLEHCGGLAYLAEIANNTPSAANIVRYAEIVRDRAKLRWLVAMGNELAERALSPTTNAEELLGEVSGKLSEIAGQSADSRPQPAYVFVTATLKALDARLEGKTDALGTGFSDLDRALNGGMRPGQLILVAARPGMGKTALSLQIAQHVASTGSPVLFCSQEMAGVDVAARLTASMSGVELAKIIAGNGVTNDDFDRISAPLARLYEMPLWIDEQAALTFQAVASKARQVSREAKGLGLLVVDYLQLMTGSGETRNAEIESISRAFKTLAKQLGIPVVLLSQLNRGVEQRPNKRPLLSDLRDSGAIEQDADVVLMLYRDEVYAEHSADRGTAEVLVRKQRQGALGAARLAWRAEVASFGDLDVEAWQQTRQQHKDAADAEAANRRAGKRDVFARKRVA